MKHITTFICLVMLIIAGTQNAQAQTKEETIEWLNINGNILLQAKIRPYTDNTEFTSDLIESKLDTLFLEDKIYDNGNFNPILYDTYAIPFSSILYQDANSVVVKDEENKNSENKYFVLQTKKYLRNRRNKNESAGHTSKETGFVKIYFHKNNEENAKRVLRAIMHLAKLSGAKENKHHF